MAWQTKRRAIRSAAFATLASALLAVCDVGDAATVESPWLFVSDLHYDVAGTGAARDVLGGEDTNPALLDSFIDAAKRIDPEPPVVVIAGDFIAHHARNRDAATTMTTLAHRLDAAFPHAQFLFTLGNNDSSCGDYAPPVGGAFLRAVAAAWAPLVDRRGAAPNFATTFARDGSYVARLPRSGLRAVVVNDNFFTLRYDARCAGAAGEARALHTFGATLAANRTNERTWVLFHVPPGIDAFSTAHIAHRLVVVPFMRPHARDAILALLADPRAHVSLAIAGHTHKFAFRIVPARGDGIPMLLVPSLSPIFHNHPSFLTVPVERDGSLGDVTQYAFDGDRWSRLGDMASLGVSRFDARSLQALQEQLLHGSDKRQAFERLYEGGGEREIAPSMWSTYVCAARYFSDRAFDACAGTHGYSFLTARGLAVLLVAGLALVTTGAIIAWRAYRRRHAER